MNAAKNLGLDAIVEIHDEFELKRASFFDPQIIGINNRDLKTLKVDLEVTKTLAPKVPPKVITICESGIKTHKDVVMLRDKVDAFLVGSSLMCETNLKMAVNKLTFGQVKVCGLTNNSDAMMAFRLGATFGGLIFARESPRYLTLKQAQKVREDVPLSWVGVFVNEKIESVADHVKMLNLGAVQLHGEENDDYIEELKTLVGKQCEIWKALRIRDRVRTNIFLGAIIVSSIAKLHKSF